MQPDNQNQPTGQDYQPAAPQQPTSTPPQPQQPYAPQQPSVQPYEQPVPGKVMAIIGLILSILGLFIPFAIAGIILSIVARVKSSRAGRPSGFAIAGIIVGIVTLIIGLILVGLTVVGVGGVVQKCQELGPGTHVVDGVTYTCGETSTGAPQ